VADALSLTACPDQVTAYSVLEALRFAATRVLDMHMGDLQILVIGHVDRDDVDALLWDPMPGGSGLLEQICECFQEVVKVAVEVVEHCPSVCETSCIDCLQTFRNGYYHKHLNRKIAMECLNTWGNRMSLSHEIPAKQPSEEPSDGTHPVNEVERKLRHLLLAAGFEEGIRSHQIRLDRAIGMTTPDVIYRAPHHDEDEGICIYLDGLSGHLHGNSETAELDQRIRTWLRNNCYDVIEIAVSDLDDEDAMVGHFRRLAGYLRADELRESIKNDRGWFKRGMQGENKSERFTLRLVRPRVEDYYTNCVPLVPLKFAAGAFSEPQSFNYDDWEWVEIDTHRNIRLGMFVAQVVGKSMEPLIPDKSYCLFSTPVAGTRQGRMVVVELLDAIDPETGERYTVKRYQSEKVTSEDGTWRHVKIILKPNNPDFQPIELTCDDEGSVRVVAELLEVLG
ncbi:MAG: S24 family peptidase, partial [Syntrophaceae bacterium]|nr:S24 family peptidase [Syntrophaceae bacterium]